ncbi:putative lipoprotein [Clostridium botulinum]|uniref:NTF2-like N-terminal transpeptidase domain-containing protein n=1 Tax=Clostridium botulinum TaxID=1491 RepID=UPI000581DE38|nr:NTF2-like N-terminal transpeptidase domain-containing protein [Clostridium botulinum]BAQ14675.1 putative lipoprotein [Clostridium botulinum]
MKKIFNKISLLFVLILSFTLIALVGCAPKGRPEETLNAYYDSIKDGDAEGAYETLCEESKKDFRKQDFIKWINTEKEIYKLKDLRVEKVKEFKGSLEDIEFKNIAEFNITRKGEDLYENKESKLTYKRYVVNDNGKWKIYFGKERGNQLASLSLNQLARMYMYGKGNKTEDLDKAASLSEEAIKLDPNNKEAKANLKALPYFRAAKLIK